MAEQVIRPTGVLDPIVEVRPTTGQVDDLLGRFVLGPPKISVFGNYLTKRMAEDQPITLGEQGSCALSHRRFIQSSGSRSSRIFGLGNTTCWWGKSGERLGPFEVSMVAILMDKEGFLRAERSLIQTIGRAARHVEGVALLYADNMTDSMAKAISETERRRDIQQAYNEKHGVVPTAAGKKASNSILSFLELSRKLKQDGTDADLVEVVGKAAKALDNDPDAGLALEALPELVDQLEAKMKEAAQKLDFEEAANLRDRVKQLRKKMAGSH